MALYPIPEGSVEVQTGLWAHLLEYTVNGNPRARYVLYSAEGYCFYNLTVPENFDEDGNLVPPNERIYAQYASTPYTTVDQVNAVFVSVPVEEGFEIVSVPVNTETA